MFGVVPRAIWEKKIPPDERNRIQLGLNCLLVETRTETVLVETGIGAAKLPPKYRDIYGADPSRGVIEALAEAGVAPAAVDRVVLTHLHMDHAGGTTVRTERRTCAGVSERPVHYTAAGMGRRPGRGPADGSRL